MSRSVARTLLVAIALLGVSVAAFTADVPLPGKRLRLFDATMPTGRRSLIGITATGIDLTGVDPTVDGATLTIFTPSTGHVQTIELPASHWVEVPSNRDTYRYGDPTDRSVRGTLLENGVIRITIHGTLAYSLGAVQNEVVVRIAVGATKFCAVYGGTITRDDGVRFMAKLAPAPSACPLAPGETTTTSTTTTSTTTTTTLPSCTVEGDACGSCEGGGVCRPLCDHGCQLACLSVLHVPCVNDAACGAGEVCSGFPLGCSHFCSSDPHYNSCAVACP